MACGVGTDPALIREGDGYGPYGWRPDLPDHRDRRFSSAAPIADRVDLRPQCPAVYDQGQLGSCTANAIAAALQFGEMRRL